MMEVVVTTGAVTHAKPNPMLKTNGDAKSSPPTNQHSVFYKLDALTVTQPSMSKHCRER